MFTIEYHLLLDLGGRPSQELQHERFYLRRAQGPGLSSTFDAEKGSFLGAHEHFDALYHWTREAERVHGELVRWQDFLDKQKKRIGNHRRQDPETTGCSGQVRQFLRVLRQWRAFHEYQKCKVNLGEYISQDAKHASLGRRPILL